MKAERSLADQCRAARKASVTFYHPPQGIIEVSGKDRVQFLQNLLSNDVQSLKVGGATRACLLEPRGTIVALFDVLCFENHLWLLTDHALKNKVIERLEKVIIMEDVVLADRSEAFRLVSVNGPKSQEVPRKAGVAFPYFFSINVIGEIGFVLFFQIGDEKTVQKCSLPPLASLQALDLLRIEAAIPRYGIDFDETTIPFEARLENAVSLSKGCFPGQEILARLDSRGGVSKKLVRLTVEGEVAVKKDDTVQKDGKEIGRVTSAAFSPTSEETNVLGYLKKGFWDAGSSVEVEITGKSVTAHVV